jgi:hypothetical protein
MVATFVVPLQTGAGAFAGIVWIDEAHGEPGPGSVVEVPPGSGAVAPVLQTTDTAVMVPVQAPKAPTEEEGTLSFVTSIVVLEYTGPFTNSGLFPVTVRPTQFRSRAVLAWSAAPGLER